MAIYRPSRPRWRAAAAAGVAGLLVGLLAGLALRGGDDPVGVFEEVRAQLRSAASTLEVVEIEYREAVDGTEVVARSEYEGALAAIDRSRAQFQEVAEALGVLSSSVVGRVTDGYEEVDRLADEPASVEELAAAIADLRDALTTFGQ